MNDAPRKDLLPPEGAPRERASLSDSKGALAWETLAPSATFSERLVMR
jgi:hypothetical protein